MTTMTLLPSLPLSWTGILKMQTDKSLALEDLVSRLFQLVLDDSIPELNDQQLKGSLLEDLAQVQSVAPTDQSLLLFLLTVAN